VSLSCTTMTQNNQIHQKRHDFVTFTLFLVPPPSTMVNFTPVQKYVALENQKMMLFEYGQPFKLHKRSRAELYKATVGR
jgi:hypothetical protein